MCLMTPRWAGPAGPTPSTFSPSTQVCVLSCGLLPSAPCYLSSCTDGAFWLLQIPCPLHFLLSHSTFGPCQNVAGLFYIRPNERTISLMDRITDRLNKEKAWDQVGSRGSSVLSAGGHVAHCISRAQLQWNGWWCWLWCLSCTLAHGLHSKKTHLHLPFIMSHHARRLSSTRWFGSRAMTTTGPQM